MGPTSKGEGRDRGKGRERKEEGKEREREGPAPLTQIPGSAGFDGREKRAGCAVLKFFLKDSLPGRHRVYAFIWPPFRLWGHIVHSVVLLQQTIRTRWRQQLPFPWVALRSGR